VRRDSVRAAAWTTSGLAKVQGDVDVDAGATTGFLSVGGKLSAGTFRSRGTFEVVGPMEVRGDLTVDGTVRLQGPVHAGAFRAQGSLQCAAEVRVDRALSIAGAFEAPSARVGLFELHGTAVVPGDVEALAVARARFRGNSEIGSVRARSVVLQGPSTTLIPTLLRAVFGGSAIVRVGRIEAESVELSAVDVDFVRAPQIVLGPGAHITAFEGTIVRQHASSRVGPESRSPPPHGLTR
jgi:cytoskeletal protein CcmA (bactofilin family)